MSQKSNWEIYAGLIKNLGGVNYKGSLEDTTYEDAIEQAKGEAYIAFDLFFSTNGVPSYDDCYLSALKELKKDDYANPLEYSNAVGEYAKELFEEIRDNIIEYYVIESERK